MPKTLMFYSILLLMSSCSSANKGASYETQVLTPVTTALDHQMTVLMAIPANGVYESFVYQDSGKDVAEAFRIEFAKFSDQVQIAQGCSGRDCLDSVPADFSGYFVDLEIMHWEDRQTAWSGRRDRVTLKVAIYQMPGSIKISDVFLQGVGMHKAMGNDHVKDMFPEIIPQYVEGLY